MFTTKVTEIAHPVWPTDGDVFGIESGLGYAESIRISETPMPGPVIKDDREESR